MEQKAVPFVRIFLANKRRQDNGAMSWATDTTEEMQAYHDDEWGRPVHEEQQLFELLTLESMQAGLSWAIILNKRETLRAAYDAFDYRKIARYDEEKF